MELLNLNFTILYAKNCVASMWRVGINLYHMIKVYAICTVTSLFLYFLFPFFFWGGGGGGTSQDYFFFKFYYFLKLKSDLYQTPLLPNSL